MNDRPLRRKYARIERERRFQLSQLPVGVENRNYERIRDLYIADSNLRLRKIETPSGQHVIAKLGQKLMDPEYPASPSHRQMTTIYLPPEEFSLFNGMAGVRSVKRRYKLPEQGWTFVIDVYEEPSESAGKILCEVECDSDEQLASIQPPEWVEREITSESSWSGYWLAGGR